jgi:hypothetical protein
MSLTYFSEVDDSTLSSYVQTNALRRRLDRKAPKSAPFYPGPKNQFGRH